MTISFRVSALLSIAAFSLASCAPERSKYQEPDLPNESWEEVRHDESTCDGTKGFFGDLAQLPNFETELPMTVNVDLRGMPNNRFEIKLSTKKRIWATAVSVFNLETCAASESGLPMLDLPGLGELTAVTGDNIGSIKIKADLSPTVYRFRMNPGRSFIYFAFYAGCTPSTTCTTANLVHFGKFPINLVVIPR
jgi:hypothetical protein